ncbi:hypothetical protein GCM10011611_37340 [Aliidongia dinghuensis]|uniref:Uncharacterized protein n=1 Tax=Aliidongia dinghuensis TaxID=1867774 RepID=A0A8J3E4X2_9PROT|nr:hypothetical protein [Aliidongia dinghuensis]GGF27881.1 hypothetical protein GCM10011611_37340 [Aliidongia dinghuensis]
MWKPLAASALALGCLGAAAARAAEVPANYDYPYRDSWLATASVALLNDPKLPEKQVKDLTLLPARARTPLFENRARVYYVTYRQEKPADLVVLISGLGSVAEDPLALYLGGQIFAMGYNVIVVPDAFNWQFALGASTSGYVGIPSVDAGDLENFIVRARDHAVRADGMKIRKTKLVGYSMGALEGAFLAAREADHPRLRFDKVVLLNPPVDTFYDLHLLDSLAATGADWSADEKKTAKAHAFKLVADARLTDPKGAPYFRDLAQRNTLTDDQLKYVLFGLFRSSLSDVIMVTQQIKDLGILKTPADATHLDAREREAAQYGFEDYLAKFIAPQLGGAQAGSERLKGETLYGLHDFLANHREVEIFHNADDFLVRPEDVAYLQATLGNRLTLFPHGGHMGNIWYPANQQALARALGSGPVPPAAPPEPNAEQPNAAPEAAPEAQGQAIAVSAPGGPADQPSNAQAAAATPAASSPPSPEALPPAPPTPAVSPPPAPSLDPPVTAAVTPSSPPAALPTTPSVTVPPVNAASSPSPQPDGLASALSPPDAPVTAAVTAPTSPPPPPSPAAPPAAPAAMAPSVNAASSPPPQPDPLSSALSPPDAPVTATVTPPNPMPPNSTPASPPLASPSPTIAPAAGVAPPDAPSVATPAPSGTVTEPAASGRSPTYTIKIPQIPQATPSEMPPS